VAVYNFSDARLDGKTVVPFGTDRQAIYQGLCLYQGGGTSLRLRDLEVLRRTATSPRPDLLVLTDMQITNLEEVMEYLIGVEGRITVVHIGENAATEHFCQVTQHHPRLQVFAVQERQDIPSIVLGQVQRYFRPEARVQRTESGDRRRSSVLNP
jgi:hypothetical protein